MRPLNALGQNFIKSRERWSGVIYLDEGGLKTGGWGHRIDTMSVGDPVSDDLGQQWFDGDTMIARINVDDNTDHDGLNDNQFAALVAFAFNIGIYGFDASTALKDLAAHDFADVPGAMMMWDKITDPETGMKVVSQGLVNRRQGEIDLWNTSDNSPQTV